MSVVPVAHDALRDHIRLLSVLLVELLRRATFHEIIGGRRINPNRVLVAVAKVLFLEFEIGLEPVRKSKFKRRSIWGVAVGVRCFYLNTVGRVYLSEVVSEIT